MTAPAAAVVVVEETTVCAHRPACPGPDDPAHEGARVVASHPEQGWVLLCNGVVVFDDTGEILPDGRTVAPHRAGVRRPVAA